MRLGGSAPPPLAVDLSKGMTASATLDGTASLGSTPGLEPQFGHLRSIVGLVWRSVVLWMLLLALLTLANLAP